MNAPPPTDAPPVRRILSCDGGGVRGVVALAILERIEALYRERRGDPRLVLADEFDLFAGTSTGAIIATCLCRGMSVADVLELYRQHGRKLFKPYGLWNLRFARYQRRNVAEMLRHAFRETPDGDNALMGSKTLRGYLLIVLRNASTGSAWPLTNNPKAMYNDPAKPDCNLRLPLWQLIRASTAAPVFFPPESISIGEQTFTFVDGGITPYNNPALIAVLTATLPAYRIAWPTGPDRLHLVSVGTGDMRVRFTKKTARRINLLDQLRHLPSALMHGINHQQDALLRVLGRCVHGAPLDRELGDLRSLDTASTGLIHDDAKALTYARYNPTLEKRSRFDDPREIESLYQVGTEYAHEHLAGDEPFFGPRSDRPTPPNPQGVADLLS